MEKYRATIHGNIIEWEGEAPAELGSDRAVTVDVQVVATSRKAKRSSGKKMAQLMTKIAAAGGIPSIKDPVKWQSEIRRDRPLPGRD
ncbi:MAG: hypothetical protein JO314_03390 [Acidobacteria bacterium]|nr:hypothetical protein [Acidobacteriota bacterium]